MIDLNKMLNDIIADALNVNIPISKYLIKKIYIDKEMNNHLAECHRFFDRCEIHLFYKTLQAKPEYIKSIIAHEILHTCFLCSDHGYPWSKYSQIMNETYGYNIKVKYSWEEIL